MIKTFKSYSRDLRVLILTRALIAFGAGLSYPFFIIYLTKRGLNLDAIGFLFAILILVSAFGSLLGGAMADALGSTSTMMLALTWRVVLVTVLALAIALGASAPLLMAIFYVHTLVGDAFMPASDAFVAERSEPRERREIFSLMRIGVNAGWALGTAAGGLLAPKIPYGDLFLMTAFIMAMITIVFKKSMGAEFRIPFHFKRAKISFPIGAWIGSFNHASWRRYLILMFLAFVGVSQLFNLMSVYLVRYRGANETTIGTLYAINGLLVILAQHWVTRRLQNHGLAVAMALGLAFYSLGFVILGLANIAALFLLSVIVLTAGEVIFMPSSLALSVHLATDIGGARWRASYLGLSHFAAVLGGFFASLLGGYLLEHLGQFKPELPWLIISGITLISAIGFYKFKARVHFDDTAIPNV